MKHTTASFEDFILFYFLFLIQSHFIACLSHVWTLRTNTHLLIMNIELWMQLNRNFFQVYIYSPFNFFGLILIIYWHKQQPKSHTHIYIKKKFCSMFSLYCYYIFHIFVLLNPMLSEPIDCEWKTWMTINQTKLNPPKIAANFLFKQKCTLKKINTNKQPCV